MEPLVRCGMYLRVSREGNNKKESDSIGNQRKMIWQYLKKHPQWKVVYEWVDDGVSGSHFQREGVQKLLKTVEEEKVDCILVKDLSRFGREYIETGYYLKEFFPKHKVRFISIGDHYDSQKTAYMEENLLLPIVNILNDAYCQDISQKVRQQQKTKRVQGAYIGAFCCYGYKKDPEDRNRLVPEEEAAKVVKKIFQWRVQKISPEKIAQRLNENKIKSPYVFQKEQNKNYYSGFAKKTKNPWSATAVRRILQNEMYTGVLIQGKSKKISYKLPDRIPLPKEQWYYTLGGVEALVDKETYKKAQIPLKSRRKEGL